MKRFGSPASLLFRLVVPASAVFILTILVVIASTFGDSRATVAQWLDRYIGILLTVEFIATMALVLLAMTVDRIRILRSGKNDSRREQEVPQINSRNHSRSDTQS